MKLLPLLLFLSLSAVAQEEEPPPRSDDPMTAATFDGMRLRGIERVPQLGSWKERHLSRKGPRHMTRTCLVMVASLTMTSIAAAQNRITITDLPEKGVRLIHQTTAPDFNIQMYSILAGKLPPDPGLMPFVVVIKNESGRTIIAHAITYEFPSTLLQGKTAKRNVCFEDVTGPKGYTMKPGDSRLDSPFKYLKAGNRQDLIGQNPDYEQPLLRRIEAAPSIHIKLDAVLFDDGTFVGDNQRVFMTLRAARMQKVKVYEAAANTRSIEELRSVMSKLKLDKTIGADEDAAHPLHRAHHADSILTFTEHLPAGTTFESFRQSLKQTADDEKRKPQIHKG